MLTTSTSVIPYRSTHEVDAEAKGPILTHQPLARDLRDLATRYAKRLAYWRSELVIAAIVLWLR